MFKKQKYLINKEFNKMKLENIEKNFYIAGGALTSVFSDKPINDLDIYFYKEEDYEKLKKKIEFNKKTRYATDLADSYEIKGVKIQLIKKIFGTPKEIFKYYDFTVCMCAYDFKTNQIIMDEDFLYDLAQKQLCFNENTMYPICSLWRIKKYLNRGYSISATNIIKLALTLNNLNINTFEDLKDQLQGIDTYLLKDLTDKMIGEEGSKKYEFREFLAYLDDYIEKKWDDMEE